MEERFDLCRKYWPQAEDPARTVRIWEAKCSLPANLRAAKSAVTNFPSVFGLTSIYIVFFLTLNIIQNSPQHWLIQFHLTVFI